MLRAASVGLGWWSGELAGAIQGKSKQIKVVSCFSRSVDKRAAFATKFGTTEHESYKAVLADPEIDAVILTTPHSLHAEHVIQAARAGKHVFVEKPFTLTADSGRVAARACDEAGVVLAVGHNRRFAAVAQVLKAMCDAGDFGTVLHLESNFSVPSALSYTADRWRASRTESPAGGIAGLGVHMIDLMCWLAGPVTQVTAQAKRRAVPVDIDDITSALFEFSSGATGYMANSLASPYTSFLNIYGTKTNAFACIDANELKIQAVGAKAEVQSVVPIETLRAELDAFARACAGDAPFRVLPAEAVHNVAVMEAIAASAARGTAPIMLNKNA